MKIIFQKEEFCVQNKIEEFSKSNSDAGAILTFIGKVRPRFNKKNIKSLDIEFYEKMALFQMKKVIKELKKKYPILDCLVIHRHGNLCPGENIVLIIVSSNHRNEGLKFLENIIEWLKVRVTFWKKENFSDHSEWVNQEKDNKYAF
ncbi:MAG: molybdenum cofactor biosynthesis protein MoaE [Alphaproteobacteria bacterium]|tara:strand:+ start:1293 stop:1730 length:438 start_codon:yes stop_codon:yes gene_type:complete